MPTLISLAQTGPVVLCSPGIERCEKYGNHRWKIGSVKRCDCLEDSWRNDGWHCSRLKLEQAWEAKGIQFCIAEWAGPPLSIIYCLARWKELTYKGGSIFPAKPGTARAPELLVHKAAWVWYKTRVCAWEGIELEQ